ncbi:hypothetical protein PENANT_c002G06531 [Penicillium antarcticum]|uniref:NmrA-like domain-containing protein n=1 Tax=Penicillium antarcticum TaxID=416450 RepID=A0A1V6QJX7_9EURO|nr:uncharacterized protein N7508_006380 [Penicillium antarcticum]KAJ5301517.1 hypothetical protein N7508_006380 [Penicillium antarcticum]OQD89549.1 hypothetical protein PENANT_c002G06531 [Penicillium antarcticum]
MSTILVTGATGKQGGSLIKNLLSKNAPFQILAVTRNIQSPSAQKLLQQSSKISLVQGDLNHPAELFKKASSLSEGPIWGVFSVQVAIGNGSSEEPQGKSLIDESIKNGVKHFVYSSVDRGGAKSSENPTKIPHFIHKHNIEKHLLANSDGKMDWTILRPTAFYENLTPDFLGKIFATSYEMVIKDAPLQMVGVSDIGAVAAEVFMNANAYKGRAIALAGDELTYAQVKNIFEKRTGQTLPTTFKPLTALFMAMVKDMGYMFKWFHDEGYGADVDEVKRIHPDVKDFETWLTTESAFVKK